MKKCAKSSPKTVNANAKNVPGRRTVTFTFKDAPGRTVCIAGSFNDWATDRVMPDKDTTGIYRLQLRLLPGEYQYKFIVDGQWQLDPENPDFVPNEFGSLNSVLTIADK